MGELLLVGGGFLGMTQHKLLDKTDRKLLSLLQEQGRIKRGELAEAVKMSIPSVSGRYSTPIKLA